MIKTGQTIYIKVVAEEITVVKVSRKTSMEIALKKAVSGVVNLITNIIYYYCSFDKRSIIYIGNLNIN